MKFGTSGLRGLVTDLQGPATVLYVTAFARHLLDAGFVKPGDRIFVAGDFRPSTPSIAASCMAALQHAGLQPIDCGAIPTPALAFYAMSQHCACLMVTGSHIPADRNGIKFYRPDGEIDKSDEEAITRIATRIGEEISDVSALSSTDPDSEAEELFLHRNASILPAGALSGLKVGVYQHSTVARDLLVDVIAGYGAKIVPLGRADHFIPVDTEAVSTETIDLLKSWAQEHALDAIVSADGDGDRPLIADETGAPLRGDLLGLIVARFLDAKCVVTPVTSNSGIENAGDFRVVRTRVGSPFVIEAMNTAIAAGDRAVMGFEANGGVLLGSSFTTPNATVSALATRDSFLPILATLLLVAEERRPLSEIAAGFRLPYALADRLENTAVEKSAALMAHLRSARQSLDAFMAPVGTVSDISDIDGLRITLTDRSIVHFRPSGNAPEMRCYIESEDATTAASLLEKSLALVRNWMRNH